MTWKTHRVSRKNKKIIPNRIVYIEQLNELIDHRDPRSYEDESDDWWLPAMDYDAWAYSGSRSSFDNWKRASFGLPPKKVSKY